MVMLSDFLVAKIVRITQKTDIREFNQKSDKKIAKECKVYKDRSLDFRESRRFLEDIYVRSRASWWGSVDATLRRRRP